jgi:hypothetical protein
MIYFVEAVGLDRVKIGTVKDDRALAARLEAFATASPVKVRLLGVTEGGRDEERALHDRFAVHRVRGEWFALAPIASSIGRMATPWTAATCSSCGAVRPLTALTQAKRRKDPSVCIECSKRTARPRVAAATCTCGKALTRTATHQHRHKGTTPRCASCARGTIDAFARAHLWRHGLRARGVLTNSHGGDETQGPRSNVCVSSGEIR